MIHLAKLNGGSPKSPGSNSSTLLSRSVASCVRQGSMLSSGTITTCIPAASAALTPLGASSKTKHWARRGEKKLFYPVSLLSLQDFNLRADNALLWVERQSRKMGISGPSSILMWWTWYFLRVIAFSFVSWDIHSIYNKQSSVPVATLHWIYVLPKSEAVLFVNHILRWCCTPFTNNVSMPTVVGWFSMPSFRVLSPYRVLALVTNSTN